MATRIEKIFKSDTIRIMDSILNEINDIVQSDKKTTAKEHAMVYKKITQSICGFYKKNNINNKGIKND